MLRSLRDGLAILLAVCVTLRVLAWLIRPIIPALIVLAVLASIATFTFNVKRRL